MRTAWHLWIGAVIILALAAAVCALAVSAHRPVEYTVADYGQALAASQHQEGNIFLYDPGEHVPESVLVAGRSFKVKSLDSHPMVYSQQLVLAREFNVAMLREVLGMPRGAASKALTACGIDTVSDH